MHKLYALLCTLLMSITAFAVDPEPFLKSATMPQNAVKIVSFVFPVIYDKPNLRADVLFA